MFFLTPPFWQRLLRMLLEDGIGGILLSYTKIKVVSKKLRKCLKFITPRAIASYLDNFTPQNLETSGDFFCIHNLASNFCSIASYRTALKDIWKSGQTNFVLDCSTENLAEVLKQAQQIGLMTFRYNYIVINMNMHTVDLEPYQYSETNITGVRNSAILPKYFHAQILVQTHRSARSKSYRVSRSHSRKKKAIRISP